VPEEDIAPEVKEKRDEIIRTISESTPYTLSDEQIQILRTIRPPYKKNVDKGIVKLNNTPMTSTSAVPTSVPIAVPGSGSIIRITAAAGTGKTETLLKLAQLAAGMNHNLITYVTFNKAAVQDGQRRLATVMEHPHQLNARTMHSCAMALLHERRGKDKADLDNENEIEDKINILDEAKLTELVMEVCKDDIESFLGKCYENIERMHPDGGNAMRKMKKDARAQACFFLLSNLHIFTKSDWSFEKFCNPRTFGRTYYPATNKVFHQPMGTGDKCGFEGYQNLTDWYPNTAAKLWNILSERDVVTYDLEMKRAQLLGLEVPGSCILVDESQDCDGCQISWLAQQADYGAQVYFVGDPAQTIYSFRGAKSSLLMKLNVQKSCTLTKSWRFGPAIARAANLVLFAKEKSPQTIGTWSPTWDPYRVTGNGNPKDMVTTRTITQNWKHQKVTIIARCNSTLLLEAVKLLGFSVTDKNSNDDKDAEDASLGNEFDEDGVPVVSQLSQESEVEMHRGGVSHHPSDKVGSTINADVPKFHINGKGGGSGCGRWNRVIKEIEVLYNLYMGSQPEEDDLEENGGAGVRSAPPIAMRLDPKMFRDFEDEDVTWDIFQQRVSALELTQYVPSIGIISHFEGDTMQAVEIFKSLILDQKYGVEEADIILTTTHAAKGQEWDNVQLCNDFYQLEIKPPCEKVPNAKKCVIRCPRTEKKRQLIQFHAKNFGDDLNLLYVACTRGKNILSVPSYLKSLILDFDRLCRWVTYFEDRVKRERMEKSSTEVAFGGSSSCAVTKFRELLKEEDMKKDTKNPATTAKKGGENVHVGMFSEIANPSVETKYQIYDDIVHEMKRELGVRDAALCQLFFNGDEAEVAG